MPGDVVGVRSVVVGFADSDVDSLLLNTPCGLCAQVGNTESGGKFNNIFIYGKSNCGKTFLVNPLSKIFRTFLKPQKKSSYSLTGLLDAEAPGRAHHDESAPADSVAPQYLSGLKSFPDGQPRDFCKCAKCVGSSPQSSSPAHVLPSALSVSVRAVAGLEVS